MALLEPPGREQHRLSTLSVAVSLSPSMQSGSNIVPNTMKGEQKKGRKKCMKQIFQFIITFFLPLITISALAGVSLTKAYFNRQEIRDLQEKTNAVNVLRKLIQNLENERAVNCLYVSTDPLENSEIFDIVEDQLDRTTAQTDEQVRKLPNNIHWVTEDPDDVELHWVKHPHYKDRQDFFEQLNDYRLQITTMKPNCQIVTNHYHSVIQFLIAQITEEFLLSHDGEIRSALQAYSTWIQGKEFASIVQSIGSGILASGEIDKHLYAYYQQAVGSANVLLEMTQVVLPAAQRSFNKEARDHHQTLVVKEEMENLLLSNNITNGDPQQAQYYVAMMTNYTEMLRNVEQSIHTTLDEQLKNKEQNLLSEFLWTLIAAVLCILICPALAGFHAFQTKVMSNKIDRRSKRLMDDEKQISRLLLASFPREIASQVKAGRVVSPESYRSVTICKCNLVGFPALVAKGTPIQAVEIINQLFRKFDDVIDRHDCFVVDQDGDNMMFVSGLPRRNEPVHSSEIATVALEILDVIKNYQIPHRRKDKLIIKMGLDTGGPCTAGVVGVKAPKYVLFGTCIQNSEKMADTGKGMRIQLTEATRNHLEQNFRGQYGTILRDENVRDNTENTYWLVKKISDMSLGIDPATADLLINDAKYLRVNKSSVTGGNILPQFVD